MLSAFFLSTLGWFFSIAASAALARSAVDVHNTYWASGDIDGGSGTYYVGLASYVVDVATNQKVADVSWRNSSACNTSVTFSSKSLGSVVTSVGGVVADCDTCRHNVLSVETMVIMGVITQIFQMTTDLQRSTRYGDMNCQKLFGCSTSIFGLVSTTGSLVTFRGNCGLSTGLPPWRLTKAMDVIVAGSGAAAQVPVVTSAGPGYALLFIAVILKASDAADHLRLPTPRAKHCRGVRERARDAAAAGAGDGDGDDAAHPWAELSGYMAEAQPRSKEGGGAGGGSGGGGSSGEECLGVAGAGEVREAAAQV